MTLSDLLVTELGKHRPRGYDNCTGTIDGCMCDQFSGGFTTDYEQHIASVLEARIGAEQAMRVGHDDGAGGMWTDIGGRSYSYSHAETFHYLYRLRGLERTDPKEEE